MGQQDIVNFLEKYPSEEFKREEIALALRKSISSLIRPLRILREKEEVYFRRESEPKNQNPAYYYRYKPNHDITIEGWDGGKDTIRLSNVS